MNFPSCPNCGPTTWVSQNRKTASCRWCGFTVPRETIARGQTPVAADANATSTQHSSHKGA